MQPLLQFFILSIFYFFHFSSGQRLSSALSNSSSSLNYGQYGNYYYGYHQPVFVNTVCKNNTYVLSQFLCPPSNCGNPLKNCITITSSPYVPVPSSVNVSKIGGVLSECTDRIQNCKSFAKFCANKLYEMFMLINCAVTCKRCQLPDLGINAANNTDIISTTATALSPYQAARRQAEREYRELKERHVAAMHRKMWRRRGQQRRGNTGNRIITLYRNHTATHTTTTKEMPPPSSVEISTSGPTISIVVEERGAEEDGGDGIRRKDRPTTTPFGATVLPTVFSSSTKELTAKMPTTVVVAAANCSTSANSAEGFSSEAIIKFAIVNRVVDDKNNDASNGEESRDNNERCVDSGNRCAEMAARFCDDPSYSAFCRKTCKIC